MSASPSLTHRTISGLVWTAGGKIAYALLHLLVIGVLARLVAPADFGVVSAALVVIGLARIVSELGLGAAVVQRAELEQRHRETAFTSSVLLGIVLAAACWATAPLIARALRIEDLVPVTRALAWLFVLQGASAVPEALARRELRFRWLANLEVIAYGVGFGLVGAVAAWAGWGVWALVAAELGQATVRLGLLLVATHFRPRRLWDRRAFAELAYFGSGFTVAKLANYVAVQGDNLVVARYLGPVVLGVYGRAYSLMSAPAYSLGQVLDAVLFPTMARVQREPKRLAVAYRRGVSLIALIVLPATGALLLAAPETVRVVLGPQWNDVVTPFRILGLGMLLRASYKMSDSLARATGAVYRRAWRQVLYAGLVLLGAWVGQHWGVAGVAWGALGALAVNFVLMAHLSLRLAGLKWSALWEVHLPGLRLALLSLPGAWGAATALRAWGAPPVVVLAGVGLAVLAIVAVLVRVAPNAFLGREGRWILEQLRRLAGVTSARDETPAAFHSPPADQPMKVLP